MRLLFAIMLGMAILLTVGDSAYAGRARVGFGFGVHVGSGPYYHPAPPYYHPVYYPAYPPPVVYVPAPAVVYVERVWVPPVYEQRVTKTFVVDGYRYEKRTEITPSGNLREVTVKVPFGHYEERVTQVLVRDGYYTSAPAPVPHTSVSVGVGVGVRR